MGLTPSTRICQSATRDRYPRLNSLKALGGEGAGATQLYGAERLARPSLFLQKGIDEIETLAPGQQFLQRDAHDLVPRRGNHSVRKRFPSRRKEIVPSRIIDKHGHLPQLD